MKMKHTLATILTLVVFICSAQIPSGYYNGTEGLTEDALWNALHSIIQNPTTVSYSSVDEKFVELGTDEDPNNSNNIIYFYMRDSRPSSNFSGNGNGDDNTGAWNKEHVWPRSRGVGDSGDDQQDMHMLRPTDVDVNSRRGSLDFGLASGNNTANGSFFEPHDEVKGDVARILFYMVTCYKGDLELVENVTNSGNQLGNLSLLQDWHVLDPVDDFERDRNDKVYSYQGNRNPFVDHPEWVNAIWGDGTISDDPVITLSKSSLDFGSVGVGASSASQSYSVSGSNLDADVTISATLPFEISLDDNAWTNQVTVGEANVEAGSNNTVYVRFSPQTENGQTYNSNVSHSSTGATTVNLAVSGTEGSGTSVDDIIDVRNGSNGQEFTIEGVVTSPELDDSHGQFFIQDATAGIFVFYSSNSNLVSRGDRVRITGTRDVFSSQVEIKPSDLTVLDTGQDPPAPVDITSSDLTTSSAHLGSLVRITGVTLDNTSQWPSSAGSFAVNVDATVNSTSFVIRIDENSFFNGTSAPSGTLVLEGVLDVFGTDVQIFPFVSSDIEEESSLDPQLGASLSSLEYGQVATGSDEVLSFTINGSDLSENVSILTAGDYSVSESSTGPFSTSVSMGVSGGVINSTLYVQFIPSSIGQSAATVNISSSGESVSVSLSGEGIEAPSPEIVVDEEDFSNDFGTVSVGQSSSVSSFLVSGSDLEENVSVATSDGFLVSGSEDGIYFSSIDLQPDGETIENKMVFVKFVPSEEKTYSGTISLSSGETFESIEVSGVGGVVTNTIVELTLKVFPNPVNGVLKIENLPANGTIRIFDSLGRRMNVKKIGEGIDVSEFDPGQYYITVGGSANGVVRFLVR